MRGIEGELCTNNKELRKAASKRIKLYREKSVPQDQLTNHMEKGWEEKKGPRLKTRIKIRKEKTEAELFEDRVWMIFYKLGFPCMNKESKRFKLGFNTYSKQIDVFAREGDNIFIIDCQSSKLDGPINDKNKLE